MIRHSIKLATLTLFLGALVAAPMMKPAFAAGGGGGDPSSGGYHAADRDAAR